MAIRILTLGVLVAAGAFSASCTIPPMDHPPEYSAIPGIQSGQTPEQVIGTLGHPQARADGWWEDSIRFDTAFQVWYYKNKGRVIFDSQMEVYTSESDPSQMGRSDGY